MSAAAAPLEDDNLLCEILIRLPPQPSSLPRASLVSKRWLSLVSDPRFIRRFRLHHRHSPPLLGFFDMEVVFAPTLEPPNRVPRGRFSIQLDDSLRSRLLGCRHGLVLIFRAPWRLNRKSHASQYQLLVWDPATGNQRRIAFPSWFDEEWTYAMQGAVLRAAGEVHFQVVLLLLVADKQIAGVRACVYSSETGAWGDLISTPLPPKTSMNSLLATVFLPAVLIGGSLYWLLSGGSSDILEFDLDRQRLAVIPLPVYKSDMSQCSVIRADGGGLGLLSLSGLSAQLWKRKTDSNGVASWVLGRTIQLNELLSMNSMDHAEIIGFAEYNNVVLLRTSIGNFMIHIESLEFKKFHETHVMACHSAFESVYTAGMAIGNDNDGAELLHNL